MAAFGILAALRERDRSGEGQLVDVSMADGALSWLAMVAARCFAEGARRARGGSSSPAALLCYRPYALRRRLGHARRAGAEVLAGVVPRRRARGPDRAPVRAARLATRTREVEAVFARAHARRVGGVRRRARLLPGAGARARRGAGLRARARARDGRRARPAGRERAGAAARRAGQALAHARRPDARARARRSASTPTRCWPRPATAPRRSARCWRRARWRAPARRWGLLPGVKPGPEDERAGRALRRLGGHDQALPARGAAAARRRDRAHVAQHGLLPAGVRRADPARSSACRRSASCRCG